MFQLDVVSFFGYQCFVSAVLLCLMRFALVLLMMLLLMLHDDAVLLSSSTD